MYYSSCLVYCKQTLSILHIHIFQSNFSMKALCSVMVFPKYSNVAYFLVAVSIVFSIVLSSSSTITCSRKYFYVKQSKDFCHVEVLSDKDEELAKEQRPLPRIEPVKIGFTRQIVFGDKEYTMKTLSLEPPVFEIVDFLSDEECELIINMTNVTGMATSETVWQQYEDILNEEEDLYPFFQKLDANADDVLDSFELAHTIQGIRDVQMEEIDIKEMFDKFQLDYFDDGKITFSEFEMLTNPDVFDQIEAYLTDLESTKSRLKSRKSFSAFLDPSLNPEREEFFEDLYQRVSKVTNLPIEMVRASEALQVLRYDVGGHYHAHHDSEDTEYAPCCHLIRDNKDICRPCRYATMFYYLNEPTEGGETAFPFADNRTYDVNKVNREENYRLNLSGYCHKANFVYKPKKGSALFWYNHVINNKTGWVGDLDAMSYHGGCDVIDGVKWAANSWLNAQTDREMDWELWREFKDR